jgi:hypothetical protein
MIIPFPEGRKILASLRLIVGLRQLSVMIIAKEVFIIPPRRIW